ncbi:MAG: hypothetical protein B7Y73_04015 [Acidocella sp. 35-58-6]|nr:MAG: hypothetical protein B7Y73_04015 [Acidocella sp. 35-58-6]
MKKILAPLTLAIFALALAGCYYPGYYGHDHYDGGGGGGYSDHGPGYGGDHGPGGGGDGDHGPGGGGGYNHP